MDDTPNVAARAFDIFSNEIVNEIKLESETYSKENAKLKHVKEFMNKIELCIDIDRAGEPIAWTTFDSANVDECPHCACGQKVANWQLRATSAIPLRKTMRNNGMKIIIAGTGVCKFEEYHPLFTVTSRSPFLCICHLMSGESGYSVYGPVSSLTSEVSGRLCGTQKVSALNQYSSYSYEMTSCCVGRGFTIGVCR